MGYSKIPLGWGFSTARGLFQEGKMLEVNRISNFLLFRFIKSRENIMKMLRKKFKEAYKDAYIIAQKRRLLTGR